jgi:hypothetical protein
MTRFKRLDRLAGWLVFAIALATYSLTVEPTASFWDCGEFIASSYKLQVPHPPGAPFFLLISRLFTLLSLGDLSRVAYWANMVSVVASAFTVLFLCWTITLLARTCIAKPESTYSRAEIGLVVGAGMVGALAYTFSDTFWFSAVEAEVYGISSFFTAIVVWAALTWARIDEPARANRWLLLIAYLTGISIGVHLLNLVTLPGLALLYYAKTYRQPTIWGWGKALAAGFLVLGLINAAIPGLPALAFTADRWAVNGLGLPFNTGIYLVGIGFIGLLVYGIYWSAARHRDGLNTALLAVAFLLIGYGSYLQVLVRAGFNPPINENDPSNVINFKAYQSREQYGSRSLLYGPVFTARPIEQKRGAPMWKRQGDKYVIYDYQPEYVYAPGDQMLFPRLYSYQLNHPALYRQMLGLADGQRPTMGDNLRFLFTYQLGHMWARYVLWNFAGRDSDEDDAGYMLPWSATESLPELLRQNKAHDNFYMLPLLLVIAGAVYQYRRQRAYWLAIGLLFVLTGIGLQVFLNSPPSEPRERDYIYVGSFYFMAIWLGLGVLALAQLVQRWVRREQLRTVLVAGSCLLVPVMMGVKSWDNHDRSDRYHSVDFAKNMLNSCAANAILFTEGDNDTFPLWYVQEVEGVRRDVRVCNLSLLGMDWYIQQMKRRVYESDAVPISLAFDKFIKGKNDYVPFYEIASVKAGIDLKQYIHLVKSDNPAIQAPLLGGGLTSILPSQVLFLPIDKASVDKAGFVPAALKPLMSDTLQWTLGKKDLYKPELIMLDMIATNNWQRPLYFSSTLTEAHYLNLKDHMQLEGYAYRLMPVAVPGASDGYVNSQLMYRNMTTKMAWRQLDNPDVYYDSTYKRTPAVSARMAFLRLADQLVREGDTDKARNVLLDSLRILPDKSIPYDYVSSSYVPLLLAVDEPKRALTIADTMARRADQNLTYAKSGAGQFSNPQLDLYVLHNLASACKAARQPEAERYEALLQKHAGSFGN